VLLAKDTVTTAFALPLRLTEPVEELPPKTDEGLTLTKASAAGVNVRVAVSEWPLRVAVIVEVVDALTLAVVTVKVTVFWPAGTTAFAGTLAEALLLVKATWVPPTPAGPSKLIVPVELVPPPTEGGFTPTKTKFAGVTVRVAVLEPLLVLAEMSAVDWELTPPPVTVNVAVVAPAATNTVAGTVALALLDDRLTEKPPVGAGCEIVTVPVDCFPLDTVVGFSVKPMTPTTFTAGIVATEKPPLEFPNAKRLPVDATAIGPTVPTGNVSANAWPAQLKT